MNTCKDCAFYEREQYYAEAKDMELRKIPIGHCYNPKIREAESPCFRKFDSEHSYSDHLVYSYNYEGGFHPGPYFGCVHWTPKESLE